MYLDCLKEFGSVLPQQGDIQITINRIITGLRESYSQTQKTIIGLKSELKDTQEKRKSEVSKLNNEFKEFRAKNDLDEYFKKYLSDETRKNTLHLVEELMQEDDWLEKLFEYKESLQKLNCSDGELKLT